MIIHPPSITPNFIVIPFENNESPNYHFHHSYPYPYSRLASKPLISLNGEGQTQRKIGALGTLGPMKLLRRLIPVTDKLTLSFPIVYDKCPILIQDYRVNHL